MQINFVVFPSSRFLRKSAITLLVNPVPYTRIFEFGWKQEGSTITNITPVSYTHLDVYKRQEELTAAINKEVSDRTTADNTLNTKIDKEISWERTKPSYEEEYTPNAPMTKKSQFGVGYTFPCLFKVGNDGWALVSETGVSSAYPASRLSDYDAAKGYTCLLYTS